MFHILVQTFCVVVAIALACTCVYKYLLDDDLAEINFQTFNDQEHAIYPSITLCFMGPDIFLKSKLTLGLVKLCGNHYVCLINYKIQSDSSLINWHYKIIYSCIHMNIEDFKDCK